MKQLTKEQHFEVFTWLVKTAGCTLAKQFEKDFEPSCCDSCADGDTCESDPVIGEGTACFESLERAKYKHVVNFDMSNIPDLTWEQSTKLSQLLSLGKIILTNQEGKQFLINTQDVKPADIIAK
jgi:hypothetical protein